MKTEREKIVQFTLPDFKPEIVLTHGYNIRNAFPMHFHRSFTLGIVEKGCHLLRMYGQEYRVSAGSIFLIPPFVPHSTESEKDERDYYKVISIGHCPMLQKTCFTEPVIQHNKLFSLIQQFHVSSEYDFSAAKCMALFDLITETILEIAKSRNCSLIQDHSRIEEARKFIEEHCTEDIHLEKMAEKAFLSPYHFIRLFHSATGVSPYAYLTLCRIRESKKKIGIKGKISDVAYETGFYDQSHFIRTFRKYVGVSPRRYFINEIQDKPGK
jgi:AraC-like DNA-binding protein/mannose-6-phosphate isomerase-like protein (cupin superfamily)